MVLAKETMTVPSANPKMAPAARVRMAAPGRERPVTATYRARKPKLVDQGLAW